MKFQETKKTVEASRLFSYCNICMRAGIAINHSGLYVFNHIVEIQLHTMFKLEECLSDS